MGPVASRWSRASLCASALALACSATPSSSDETTSDGPGSTGPSTTTGLPGSTTAALDSTTTTVDPTTTSTTTAAASTSTTGTDDGPVFDLAVPDMPGNPIACTAGVPVIAAIPCDPLDVTLVPPFDVDYDCLELAEVPGVPSSHGGVSFSRDDPDLLLIGGSANTVAGQLYAIEVTRDADCHVIGFAQSQATVYATAAYNDGGVDYGPDDVLFLARWPVNELGQLLPGSVATDRIDLLAPLGVGSSSIAGLTFVPPTYPGEGQLKVITWEGGEWFTLPFLPAGDGTFDLGPAVPGPVLPGGPEGIVYVSGDNDGFDDVSLLVSEWSAGNVVVYDIDAQGDPLVGTRQEFIVGLTGAEGAHIDPTGGDFLFSTFGGGDRLVIISGFVPNPTPAG